MRKPVSAPISLEVMARVEGSVGALLDVQTSLFHCNAGGDKGRLKHHIRARQVGKGLYEMFPLLHSDRRLDTKAKHIPHIHINS